jgi:hypothetical protein
MTGLVTGWAGSAFAQPMSRFSVDSVGAIDLFTGEGTTDRPNASVDISAVARLSDHWFVNVRPWFFKSAQGSDWSKEIYQAAVRYERPGALATRVEAGYVASPIGLGMLDMRADTNPLVRPHLSYFVPLLPFDRPAPTVGPITASYPLGGIVTLSTSRWDARAAIVSSAPTRAYAINRPSNPRPTPVLIVGGGLTPRPGMRLGMSAAAGHYATKEELSDPAAGDRHLTMWSVEGEHAFGYTKIAGELTQEYFGYGPRDDRAGSWFVKGVQTLTPRWFVAARHEGTSAPPFAPGGARMTYRTIEAAAGFRVTPELTLRGSWFNTRWYTSPSWDQQAGVSIVWARRWW